MTTHANTPAAPGTSVSGTSVSGTTVPGAAASAAAHQRFRAAPSGPVLWFATVGSIVTWMVHLVAEASLVPLREQHESVVWVMHAVTVVLALVVLLGMWISRSYTRIGSDDESVPNPVGRTVFLGYVGLVIGAIDLFMILYEGAIVTVLRNH